MRTRYQDESGQDLATSMTIKKTWKKERRVYIYKCVNCGKTRQTYKRKKTREMCRLCKRTWVNPNQGTLFPEPKVEVLSKINKATGETEQVVANGVELYNNGPTKLHNQTPGGADDSTD